MSTYMYIYIYEYIYIYIYTHCCYILVYFRSLSLCHARPMRPMSLGPMPRWLHGSGPGPRLQPPGPCPRASASLCPWVMAWGTQYGIDEESVGNKYLYTYID